jgi:tetratricopeptide (TPR) repeat protein/tRNA A-37 threonylcarbamoyl transferase component Bud32
MDRADADQDDPTATSVTVDDKPGKPSPELADLAIAKRIDRFVILDKLGEGGMGAVYAAYDTVLDRKVAIKVVRPTRHSSRAGVSPRDRLLREAQAMARLHHPNVVAVLDVGEVDNDVYLALELVDGQTLKGWLRETRPSWRQIVATFVEAGRGLVASHAVGLVHRDVKPDNILVGKDGRTRITDFGVVSMHHGRRDGATTETQRSGDSEEDTLSGFRVGTPAYMAPEQFAGETVDARADQFSFCVALWEGLFGERPFPTPSGKHFKWQPMREVPRDADVPSWLVAALRRGLELDPQRRWPSIDALLAELTRDRGIRRRVIGTGVAIALLVSVTLAFVGWTRDRAPAAAPCQNEARHLAGIWDATRSSMLAAKLRATGAPGADAIARRVRDHLDAWARGWVEQRTASCAATRIHGDQSDAMLDANMRCLDRRLVRVGELVRELGSLGAAEQNRALELAADLPDFRACADSAQLTSTAPLPTDPDLRKRIEAIEQELARVVAVERTGRYPAALAHAVEVLERAAATRYAPVHAEALAAVGRLRVQTGEHATGITALREAATLAAKGQADDVAASALVELVWATGEAGRGTEAVAVAAAVAPSIARVHDQQLEASLAAEVGGAHLAASNFVAATAELERSLALIEAALGRDHIRLAQVLNRLGSSEDQRNRPAQARAYYARALAIGEANLGPEHPSVAITRANICYLDATAGKLTEAAACHADVIAKLEAALGAQHPQVAWALNDAGLVEQERGRTAQARAAWERAVTIYERTSGAQHPDIAYPLINLGALALRDHDTARAETLCRQALRLLEAASPEHGMPFEPLVCLGASLADRRSGEAITLLERALGMDEAQHDAHTRGTAQFALARVHATRGNRRAAAKHARDALAALTEAGTSADADRAELITWMKRQRL